MAVFSPACMTERFLMTNLGNFTFDLGDPFLGWLPFVTCTIDNNALSEDCTKCTPSYNLAYQVTRTDLPLGIALILTNRLSHVKIHPRSAHGQRLIVYSSVDSLDLLHLSRICLGWKSAPL